MPQKAIRHRNATRIFHAIRTRPGLTQRDIVALVGTDKSTVSTVLRDFEARALVERIEIASRGGRGRPSEGYRIAPSGGVLVGVHLRPAEIRLVLTDMAGQPRAVLARPMSAGPETLGADMAAGISGLLVSAGVKESALRGVGLAVPGLVQTDGLVRQSPNLGWSDFNPLAALRAAAGLRGAACYPAFIGNNANGTTLAEMFFGGRDGARSFLLLLTGSGVGGGIVVDGALVRGDRGMAGEFGHHKIRPGGRLCHCGTQGCLSAYVANWALLELAREAGVDVTDFGRLIEAVRDRHPAIEPVVDAYCDNLAIGIVNMATVLGVGEVVLSGGVRQLYPHIAARLEGALTRFAHPALREDIRVVASEVGTSEVPLGGVAIALEGCTGSEAVGRAPWSKGEGRKVS